MIRFEIDPNLVADAIREGRKLVVEVYQTRGGTWTKAIVIGDRSPHAPNAFAPRRK